MRKSRVLWIAVGLVGGLLFVWFVVLKLLSKLMGGHGGPCPSSLGWFVDNPPRRRYMRPVLERVGLRPGETALELGPGPGAFTAEAAGFSLEACHGNSWVYTLNFRKPAEGAAAVRAS